MLQSYYNGIILNDRRREGRYFGARVAEPLLILMMINCRELGTEVLLLLGQVVRDL